MLAAIKFWLAKAIAEFLVFVGIILILLIGFGGTVLVMYLKSEAQRRLRMKRRGEAGEERK